MLFRRPIEGIPAGITAHAQPTMPDWLETLAPVLWLRSDLLVESGGAVSSWTDRSGGAHHAVQATGAKQPAVVENWLNGKRGVRGNGTSSILLTDNIDLTAATGFTIACVRADTDTALRVGFSRGSGGTGFELYPNGNAAGGFQLFYKGAATAARQVDSTLTTFTFAAPALFVATVDTAQAAAAELTELRYAGAAVAYSYSAGAGVETSGGFGNIPLALFARASDAFWSASTIGEVILFDRPLDAAERATLETNVNAYWGL